MVLKKTPNGGPLSWGPRNLSYSPEGSTTLTSFSQKFWVDQPFIWDLVVGTSEVFLQVQNEYKSSYPDPVPPKIATALSRMYRGNLLEHCNKLKGVGDIEGAELYSNLDFVWNFCEIMFLASHPDFPVTPYLRDWICLNFDLSAEILPRVLDMQGEVGKGDSPELDELWTLVNSHVFHGMTSETVPILEHLKRFATAVEKERLDLMSELMRKKPEYELGLHSVTEFEALFQGWQEECLNRLENGAFYEDERLTFLCKILCGEEEAFKEAADKRMLTWYEYLGMYLTYKCPTVRPSHLKVYGVKALEAFGLQSGEGLSGRDVILLHAMDFNLINLLKEIQHVWDNEWFALHFLDLIFASGRSQSDEENIDYSCVTPLRNHLIMEFGSCLMEHATLWQLGICYLESLPDQTGKGVIRECIQRRQPYSESEAQKLIQICERFGFGEEIKGICRQVALRKLQLDPSSRQNALLWAIKAGDETLTTRLVDGILLEGEGEIETSLLDSLKSVLPCSNRLLFLQEFCSFKRCLEEENSKGAVDRMCSMISENLLPIRLAPKILEKYGYLLDIGSNFEHNRRNISILMEFLHCSLSKNLFTEEEFENWNRKLVKIRAQEIVTSFRKNTVRSQ